MYKRLQQELVFNKEEVSEAEVGIEESEVEDSEIEAESVGDKQNKPSHSRKNVKPDLLVAGLYICMRLYVVYLCALIMCTYMCFCGCTARTEWVQLLLTLAAESFDEMPGDVLTSEDLEGESFT